MAIFYVLGCTALLIINHEAVPGALRLIFTSAFSTQAVFGGAAGITVQQAMRVGVAKGLFSNEAGMGSTPHAHALAKVKHPQEQGEIAMVSVFIDTFVVLTLTAMVILTSDVLGSGATGAALAQLAFSRGFGKAGDVFIALCMLFFAFSTIIGWYFFGEINFKALFGKKGPARLQHWRCTLCAVRFAAGGGAGMESLRPLQRTDGDPQPDCSAGPVWPDRQNQPGGLGA